MRYQGFFKYSSVFAPAIGFTFLLLTVRSIYAENLCYAFLAWNLFLAFIPVLLSQALNLDRFRKLQQAILFTGWLLFFPNSLYIVTDLVHLRERPPVPLWYDIILIFSAATTGFLAAYVSLWEVEIFLDKKFKAAEVKLIILSSLAAAAFGVYLGRYVRWNSWDVFTDPLTILTEIITMIFYPENYIQSWSITIVYSVFFAVIYFTIKSLRRLSNDW